ncbi:hypothetical protein WN944_029204 [Citrus x changshan-huyou]|uniref:Uncharacterized protein n=1 Tax=Citrus x changshan-huyou TaxID=2935761 RepID=A0AAP0QA47_9ROSI
MTFFGLIINLEKLDLARCAKIHDGLVHPNVETVDVNDCGDLFLESQLLKEGVRVLNRKSRSKHLGLKQWPGNSNLSLSI